MIKNGVEVTSPGCLLLQLEADARSSSLREYWHREPGQHDALDGWGE